MGLGPANAALPLTSIDFTVTLLYYHLEFAFKSLILFSSWEL